MITKGQEKSPRGGERLSMPEATVESKNIDADMKKQQHENSERQNAGRHEEVMSAGKETSIRLQIQLEMLKRGNKANFNQLN